MEVVFVSTPVSAGVAPAPPSARPYRLAVEIGWLCVLALPTGASIVAAIVLAVCSTALATFVYFRLLSTLGSIGTTSNSYLRAIVSVVLGVALLGEQPTWPMIGGL